MVLGEFHLHTAHLHGASLHSPFEVSPCIYCLSISISVALLCRWYLDLVYQWLRFTSQRRTSARSSQMPV